MSDIIDAENDYGIQTYEVIQTQHADGKCVGCPDSYDSWCKKHQQWGCYVSCGGFYDNR